MLAVSCVTDNCCRQFILVGACLGRPDMRLFQSTHAIRTRHSPHILLCSSYQVKPSEFLLSQTCSILKYNGFIQTATISRSKITQKFSNAHRGASCTTHNQESFIINTQSHRDKGPSTLILACCRVRKSHALIQRNHTSSISFRFKNIVLEAALKLCVWQNFYNNDLLLQNIIWRRRKRYT